MFYLCHEFYDSEAGYREEVKSIVREAMDEWTSDCEYLTKATDKDGRYYCSKPDCGGVRFPTPDKNT